MIIPPIQSRRKAVRSFVIRAGRITQGQIQAFERSWQTYGLDLEKGLIDNSETFQNHNPLVLEIGFGDGESLLQQCQLEPRTNFIGIEVHPPGMGHLLQCVAESNISNLRLYLADATDVLDECIADNTLHRIQLFFPDPWHKKKHHKRRILQPQTIELFKQKLQPEGILHIATDWQPYAECILENLVTVSGLKNSRLSHSEKPSWRPTTKYEQRGINRGYKISDILFIKS